MINFQEGCSNLSGEHTPPMITIARLKIISSPYPSRQQTKPMIVSQIQPHSSQSYPYQLPMCTPPTPRGLLITLTVLTLLCFALAAAATVYQGLTGYIGWTGSLDQISVSCLGTVDEVWAVLLGRANLVYGVTMVGVGVAAVMGLALGVVWVVGLCKLGKKGDKEGELKEQGMKKEAMKKEEGAGAKYEVTEANIELNPIIQTNPTLQAIAINEAAPVPETMPITEVKPIAPVAEADPKNEANPANQPNVDPIQPNPTKQALPQTPTPAPTAPLLPPPPPRVTLPYLTRPLFITATTLLSLCLFLTLGYSAMMALMIYSWYQCIGMLIIDMIIFGGLGFLAMVMFAATLGVLVGNRRLVWTGEEGDPAGVEGIGLGSEGKVEGVVEGNKQGEAGEGKEAGSNLQRKGTMNSQLPPIPERDSEHSKKPTPKFPEYRILNKGENFLDSQNQHGNGKNQQLQRKGTLNNDEQLSRKGSLGAQQQERQAKAEAERKMRNQAYIEQMKKNNKYEVHYNEQGVPFFRSKRKPEQQLQLHRSPIEKYQNPEKPAGSLTPTAKNSTKLGKPSESAQQQGKSAQNRQKVQDTKKTEIKQQSEKKQAQQGKQSFERRQSLGGREQLEKKDDRNGEEGAAGKHGDLKGKKPVKKKGILVDFIRSKYVD